ncbi:MAG: hydratase [Lachnospiraceae bacterium]|nr:hydratase [Lachnospiraceae bacterium]
MVQLYESGAYLLKGESLVADGAEASAKIKAETGKEITKEEAKKGTIAYGILDAHDTVDAAKGSGTDARALKIRFDSLISHDITYVGIIQTARASGLEKFPLPYALTNCHNSLCAVGGTINEDDHVFGLTAAKKYGGIYVPPHQAVIHQYAREQMATAGGMILGSDSHTRYGALGTMAIGEGGPELVKQLLQQTYDINYPEVIAIYLKGEPVKGVGPQDVALAIIGAVFDKGYVKNKIMEFVGPGVASLSAEFRIGVDVMTTETTCLSSVWRTDERAKEYYDIHERGQYYKELNPAEIAYYDGVVEVDLSAVRPMIAMPFHPSNTYTIEEVIANPKDILHEVEEKAKKSLDGKVEYSLQDKIVDGRLKVEQGLIAGCAGGTYENIVDAADILRGHYIGSDEFSVSVYPSSTPIYMELLKNGVAADILETGAILKTAFCGPCFGAGDTPSNGSLSVRHSTRNFPNREGSKIQNGQIASVALMDARSIAATAAAGGFLTPATEFAGEFRHPAYHYDANIYGKRVFDSKGVADGKESLRLGPNIKDWPKMSALPDHLLLRVVSEIHDEVTTTDELIPSGETSSYRSNPEGLAEFTLSRRDPEYVGLAKEIRAAQTALVNGEDPLAAFPELRDVLKVIYDSVPGADKGDVGFGSTIFAVKPGDGSAREQAASCQKVLGGWANIANEYATKRYRSNLINWGMLPFVIERGVLPFARLDYVFLLNIRRAVENAVEGVLAFAVHEDSVHAFTMTLGELTDKERQIILDGCLINYNAGKLTAA